MFVSYFNSLTSYLLSIFSPQDLILFPGDASFVKVAESSSGRVFVLKFESSDQKHFVSLIYWVISVSDERSQYWIQV